MIISKPTKMSQVIDKSRLHNSLHHLHVTLNEDGTVTRSSESFEGVRASIDDPSSPALSRDIPINPENNTWVRVFLPKDTPPSTKLPILIHIHGGGFIVGSPDFVRYHEFCSLAACLLGALVVSVKYRLVPEHRLPAAYDDVYETLRLIDNGKDEWVREFGDLSKCILMGESAGGNIAYHVGLKAACEIVSRKDLKLLVVNGMVLIQAYFCGLDRTESEIRVYNSPNMILSLALSDFLWEVSLPEGADRGHEYCDPIRESSNLVDNVRDSGMWVMVVGCDGDPFYDKGVEMANWLERKGVSVKTMFSEGGRHGMYIGAPGDDFSNGRLLLDFVKDVWA